MAALLKATGSTGKLVESVFSEHLNLAWRLIRASGSRTDKPISVFSVRVLTSTLRKI